MLGFSPLSGAPLAGTGGLYTLTLSASNSVFASNVKTVNMVRASTSAMAAIVLRILPKGVIATAAALATAALSIRYALQATQIISATGNKLASKILSVVSPTLATSVKTIQMIRSASSTLAPVAIKSIFKTLTTTPLSAVGASVKNIIITLQSSVISSAIQSRILNRVLASVCVTTATRMYLIITSTLTRKASALFTSRTAMKQAESRISKG